MAHRTTAAALVVTAGLLVPLTGCGDRWKNHTPLERLDDDYKHGQQARASMQHHGVPVTDQSCADMYTSTGAEEGDTSQDKTWLADRRTAYVNGCMDRPRTGLAPTAKPSPNLSPTPSSDAGGVK